MESLLVTAVQPIITHAEESLMGFLSLWIIHILGKASQKESIFAPKRPMTKQSKEEHHLLIIKKAGPLYVGNGGNLLNSQKTMFEIKWLQSSPLGEQEKISLFKTIILVKKKKKQRQRGNLNFLYKVLLNKRVYLFRRPGI